MKTLLLACSLLSSVVLAFGQGVQPGKMYEAGDQLTGPIYGIQSRVPQGWMGLLPMDSEIFLLVPSGVNADGEIYVTADTIEIESLKQRWLVGLDLDNGNTLKSDGNIFMRGDALASNVILEGNGASFKGYIEAKCGDYGTCISFLLLCPPQFYDKLKVGLLELSDNTSMVEPSMQSIYDDFDWNKFLSGKYIANFDYVPGAKSENELWLCSDGTFRSKLKRSGFLKEEVKEYQGKKNGNWKTSSVGKTGILTLDINKMGSLEIELTMDNDRLFINGKRFFAMLTDECK